MEAFIIVLVAIIGFSFIGRGDDGLRGRLVQVCSAAGGAIMVVLRDATSLSLFALYNFPLHRLGKFNEPHPR
jgi:hypothetical protein